MWWCGVVGVWGWECGGGSVGMGCGESVRVGWGDGGGTASFSHMGITHTVYMTKNSRHDTVVHCALSFCSIPLCQNSEVSFIVVKVASYLQNVLVEA